MAKLPQVDTAIRGLVPEPGHSQTAYYDERTPGLALIVGKKVKGWSLTYRPAGGKRKRIAFGRYPAVSLAKARERAQGVFSSLHNDVDPAARRKAHREAPSVAEAGEQYLSVYASRKASYRFDEGVIRNELVPQLGERKLIEVTRADVQAVLRGISERGAGIMANRTLQVIRKFLAWSIEQGWLDLNPADGISRPTTERARTRTLSEVELRDLWNALVHVSRQAQAGFKLLLLTGQREMEVMRMRWSEIDLQRGVWTLPPHDPGRSKARLAPHLVPLTTAAVHTLRELQSQASSAVRLEPGGRIDGIPSKAFGDYVFRGRHRNGDPASPTRGILVTAKQLLDTEYLSFGEPWRIHDLRRTVRTGLSQLSVPPHIAELVIGHSIGGIVKVYDRYDYLTEKREALTRWADHLMSIASDQRHADNVVPISTAKAS
jgi:integrase